MSVENGFVLFYVKDGTLYPVALTEEQKTMFDLCMRALSQTYHPIRVIENRPQGKVANLLDEGE